MKEHFTISIPNSLNYPNLPKILVSALLSALIIYPILIFIILTHVYQG
jgi:hypothetical protein